MVTVRRVVTCTRIEGLEPAAPLSIGIRHFLETVRESTIVFLPAERALSGNFTLAMPRPRAVSSHESLWPGSSDCCSQAVAASGFPLWLTMLGWDAMASGHSFQRELSGEPAFERFSLPAVHR